MNDEEMQELKRCCVQRDFEGSKFGLGLNLTYMMQTSRNKKKRLLFGGTRNCRHISV
jgi:hypothetical protein